MEKTTLEKEKLYDSLPTDQKMKLEIAEELGLLDKINVDGWKSLTPKETGRIGGLMTKRKREMKSKAAAEAAMIEDVEDVESVEC